MHCQPIMEGRHVDVIEMDAASNNGIDDVREIIEAVRYKPVSARYKVYILDEVHMLSGAAFNAFLKTLEEPPPHVKFIFATTEIRKVPVTVLSRCQRFDLRRIESGQLVGLLGAICARRRRRSRSSPRRWRMIARAAEGSARDSLSLLDQAIAHGAGIMRAEDVRAMLGLADRARVVDLFEALMARPHGAEALEGPEATNTTSAPTRRWCCRISPPSPISSRASRWCEEPSDQAALPEIGAPARGGASPPSCRCACCRAPGRC